MDKITYSTWVKASENDAPIRKRLPIKNDGDYTDGWLHENGFYVTGLGTVKDKSKIEWLQEQTGYILTEEQMKERDVKIAEGAWNNGLIVGCNYTLFDTDTADKMRGEYINSILNSK